MRSLDSISFHSRWLVVIISIEISRHPDESRTLLSIGRIDKVYHQHRHPNKALVSLWSRKLSGLQRYSTKSLNTPDSSREKQVESLRKTEYIRHPDESRTLLSTKHRHPDESRTLLSTKHRHPDEPCTLFSIGRIDKVSHKVPDSSREKQVESLRKTECLYEV